jgi:hypothetical protein
VQVAGICDRACLPGLINLHVDALVARDHSRLPLALQQNAGA